MSFVKEYRIGSRVKKSEDELAKGEERRQEQRLRDSRLVTGTFKNLEVRGGDVTFSYRIYKEDAYQTYHFEDGKTYTIPFGVATHIKEVTKRKKHAYLVDREGKKITGIGSFEQRYEFIPTEFK